ncbi:rhomboid family intramembrane serine protease [Chryseobacterium indologenes]|uniref:Rhomboid family intramembrane serine protease n=1 Tax=Chryseobacterium indologenes TaxID=253 RepID=A0AAD1DVH7_CHRID|nr:rhomboid family intramembrane serine protease [Chryseobacterium indologenes]ASE62761.1 rhomboid family intramembrane serine protease [Chryseobacterium indologenes]AZB18461.1 rhomboid family intramembrane serine protease [Chryseobacterium indologenes]VFA42276.1 Rhomboid protease gluP [Chryseobacterium indologenes]
MTGFTDKMRLIYKPFVLIAIGFILIYTLLNWILFIKIEISIKEEVPKFWLPIALPWIPILIWLRPRLCLLQIKNENSSFFLQILAWIAITIPTVMTQEYLNTSTGTLTQLDTISQFVKHNETKYYSLKNSYIDKKHISIQKTATVTGKHNENLVLLVYVVIPILDNSHQIPEITHKYWLGKKYSEKINNNLSDYEKNEKFKTFVIQSENEFNKTDFGKFSYLKVIGNTDDHDEFNIALKNLRRKSEGDRDIIFESRTEPFESRNTNKISSILIALGAGLLGYFIILLFFKFDKNHLENFKKGIIEKNTDVKDFFDFFIPKEGFYITPIIINLNILIFMIMVFTGHGILSFKGEDLLHWGANFKPSTINGQWWRLVTSIFLHGGIMHIAANMYGLLFVGIFLEPLLSKTKYALLYLITGILASITSLWWYDATISVGASGAIFGLYGFFLACLLLNVFPPDLGKAFLVSTLVFVGVNLLMGLTGGTDNAAHIGGLVSGFILGLIMAGQIKQQVKITIEHENENVE